jgi:putative ABC transport system permease protein
VKISVDGKWRAVVGVVGDVLHKGLDAPQTLQFYVPNTQWADSDVVLVLRTAQNPALLVTAVRDEIAAIDPQTPVSGEATMEDVISASVANQRFGMILFGLFAAIALTLAAAGIYGVISYGIAEHTHEIGIRMALGASHREVLGLVVGGGMKPALLGAAVGLVAAFGLAHLLAGLLYGVTPTDLATFLLTPAILICIALLACYVPARRAMRVDPMLALRHE